MKNIYVIPTSKPNSGYVLGKCIKELSDVKVGEFTLTYYLMFSEEYFEPHNLYITSNEEIKEGKWTLKFPFGDEIFKNIKVGIDEYVKREKLLTYPYDWCKKIILTTDVDLINDGVQAIDMCFLEWFVKNPGCKYVELEDTKVVKEHIFDGSNDGEIIWQKKINIPTEEKYIKKVRTYSESEVIEQLNILMKMPSSKIDLFTDEYDTIIPEKWFEQFKN